jgi:hypothetical protein
MKKARTGQLVVEPAIDNEATTPRQHIENLIERIRVGRRTGANAALEQGKRFSELRDLTKPYEKDKKSGLSYHKSIGKTGYGWGTAERYRALFETVTKAGISADIYLALVDHGCDLAAKRTATAAGIVQDLPDLLKLDVADESDVTVMVERINKNYPVERKAEPKPTALEAMEETLINLKTMPKNAQRDKMIATTECDIAERQKATLLTLAIALAPFLGQDKKWAEGYAKEVGDNTALLKQRYSEAVKFAKSAQFLRAKPEPESK